MHLLPPLCSVDNLREVIHLVCLIITQKHTKTDTKRIIVSLGYNCCMSVWENFTGDTKNCVTKSIFNRQQLNKHQ